MAKKPVFLEYLMTKLIVNDVNEEKTTRKDADSKVNKPGKI
jgi:hypothetical protein